MSQLLVYCQSIQKAKASSLRQRPLASEATQFPPLGVKDRSRSKMNLTGSGIDSLRKISSKKPRNRNRAQAFFSNGEATRNSSCEASSSVPLYAAESRTVSTLEAVKSREKAFVLPTRIILVAVIIIAVVCLAGSGIAFYKPIMAAIQDCLRVIPEMGFQGLLIFMGLYILLELLSIPVVPLTVSSGVMFGAVQGMLICCMGSTVAAVLAFSIARYGMRDWVADVTRNNAAFNAIDKKIGADSFRVTMLLRISPLLPLSIANYLYGVTSVKIVPYTFGTFFGLMPGAFMQCSAAAMGKSMLGGGAGPEWWQMCMAAILMMGSVTYIGTMASQSLKDMGADVDSEVEFHL
mmetsp:Transcript_19226/g.36821  ORF Transcript_19226/g.36821 Transcript_19226/m.36821 type:complete len:349 (+) Transcript_19226:145-1191(+)